MMPAVLYLHGFLSSPDSMKGRLLKKAAEEAGMLYAAPDLNIAPALAAEYLTALAESFGPASRLTVVGSSLGGFYAGWLAHKTGAKAVLINPCLRPWAFLGEAARDETVYGTDRRVRVLPDYGKTFQSMAAAFSPVPARLDRTMTLLSTADEVLDWTEAWRALRGSRMLLSAEDNHRMMRFEAYLPAILSFVRG